MTHNKLQPLNLPQPVSVCLDGTGQPRCIANSHASAFVHRLKETDAGVRNHRVVETIIEVWRVDDEWWRQPISRRYVEVVLQGGRHVALYEDLNTGEWFMQKI